MKSTLSNVLLFTLGAAVGSLVTWKILDEKYKQIRQEEADSFKEKLRELRPDMAAHGEKDASEAVIDGDQMAIEGTFDGDIHEYAAQILEQGYTNYGSATVEEVASTVNKPYVIRPEEFATNDEYETETLYYCADHILMDDMNNMIEDVERLVGYESLKHFGEYDDEAVYVRNDKLKIDFEILIDLRNFTDIIKPTPHPSEDE